MNVRLLSRMGIAAVLAQTVAACSGTADNNSSNSSSQHSVVAHSSISSLVHTSEVALSSVMASQSSQSSAAFTGVRVGDVYVTDSANDGNLPENTLDGSTDTKWASAGVGQWIQFAWEAPQTLYAIEIAFSNGALRTANFEVQTSMDGDVWTSVYTGVSGGETQELEVFDVVNTLANYVRIIGNGNSSGGLNWNAYTRVELNVEGDPDVIPDNGGGNMFVPTDIIPSLVDWKITLPVDSDGNDSAQAANVDERNTKPIEVEDDKLEGYEYPPYFYATAQEVFFRAHAAGATTSGSKYPRSELRQRVGGGDEYWSVDDYQFLSVDLRVTAVPVIKPEISVVQIHGPENEPLRVQYSTSQGIVLIWNESNKKTDLDLDYNLGDRLRVEVSVSGGKIKTIITNLENSRSNEYEWVSNDSTGYFKVGAYTQSSIFLNEFKDGYDVGEPLDAYGEVAVSNIELHETFPHGSGGNQGGGDPVVLPEPLPVSDLNTVPVINCGVTVSTASALEDAVSVAMSPGTTICIADGTYNNVELTFGGAGTEVNPIHVTAQNPGKVFFELTAQVRMVGTYVIFQGITFQNGNSADGDLFQTRASGMFCDHCRITENVVQNWDKTFGDSNRWLLVYGQYNRIDHNWFSGKTTRGALLTVDRGEIIDPDYAQIDHNYFGDRLPFAGGEFPAASDNEFEGIRVGTSDTQAYPSYSRVEYNYMERMRGEAEVISNKSGHNVIANNTVRSSYGGIVSRHGSNTTIENNFIFSDGYGMSGGIRLAGANHRVINNYVEGCTYTGSTFNGGIVLTRTDGDQATSGYQQVDNVLIAHNTVVNCTDSIKLSGGRSSSSKLPTNVFVINNVVANAVGDVFVTDLPSSITFRGNYFGGDALGLDAAPSGVTFGDPAFGVANDGLYRPLNNSPVIGGASTNFGDFSAVLVDMDGQVREGAVDSGADEIEGGSVVSRPLVDSDVGPKNYRP